VARITVVNFVGSQRQPYLDWLRVLGTLSVFLFHCARFLDSHDWHVKSRQTSPAATVFVEFTVQWLMPLFFMVSAGSAWFASSRRSPRALLRERLQRLGIPFVFGVFVLIPPQVYLERLL
jgi:fucose 4-O-acetylase-like acetyltransferase